MNTQENTVKCTRRYVGRSHPHFRDASGLSADTLGRPSEAASPCGLEQHSPTELSGVREKFSNCIVLEDNSPWVSCISAHF